MGSAASPGLPPQRCSAQRGHRKRQKARPGAAPVSVGRLGRHAAALAAATAAAAAAATARAAAAAATARLQSMLMSKGVAQVRGTEAAEPASARAGSYPRAWGEGCVGWGVWGGGVRGVGWGGHGWHATGNADRTCCMHAWMGMWTAHLCFSLGKRYALAGALCPARILPQSVSAAGRAPLSAASLFTK